MSKASATLTMSISLASASISTSFRNVMPLLVSTLWMFVPLST